MPKQGICRKITCKMYGNVQNRPDNSFLCFKCKSTLKPYVEKKVLPKMKKKVAKIKKSPREENLVKIISEAKKRIIVVADAAGWKTNPYILKISNSWLKINKRDGLTDCLIALTDYMDRSSITLGSMSMKPVGETPTRPYGSFPGVIHPKAVKTKAYLPISGIIMNPKYISNKDYKAGDEYLLNTNFFNRTWTLIHELTHAILSTNDYRVVKYKNLKPFAEHNYLRQQDAMKPTEGITSSLEMEYKRTREKSAEDWAGFIMNAYIYVEDLKVFAPN